MLRFAQGGAWLWSCHLKMAKPWSAACHCGTFRPAVWDGVLDPPRRLQIGICDADPGNVEMPRIQISDFLYRGLLNIQFNQAENCQFGVQELPALQQEHLSGHRT
jgi:hypothetical protein